MFVIFSFVKRTEEIFRLIMVAMGTKKVVLLRFPWQWLLRENIPLLISES